jgi:hypothetical protein
MDLQYIIIDLKGGCGKAPEISDASLIDSFYETS